MSAPQLVGYQLVPFYEPAEGEMATAAVASCMFTGKMLSGMGGGGEYLSLEAADAMRRARAYGNSIGAAGIVYLDKEEMRVVAKIGADQELSDNRVVEMAIAAYQRDHLRRKDGETCVWSGDAQRQRDFYDPRRYAWNADDIGMTPDDHREMAWGMDVEDARQRWKALKALWGPAIKQRPRDSRKGWTVYDGYERNRDEEWTWWGAVCATIGIVLDRSYCGESYLDSRDMAFWDARDVYGGYEIMRLWLYPGCWVSIFSDGECTM